MTDTVYPGIKVKWGDKEFSLVMVNGTDKHVRHANGDNIEIAEDNDQWSFTPEALIKIAQDPQLQKAIGVRGGYVEAKEAEVVDNPPPLPEKKPEAPNPPVVSESKVIETTPEVQDNDCGFNPGNLPAISGQADIIESISDGIDLEVGLAHVQKIQAAVKKILIENEDFGTIPGCGKKPALLKGGAEKMINFFRLRATFEIMSEVNDWETPFFMKRIKCHLSVIGIGTPVGEGFGACNSKESKYYDMNGTMQYGKERPFKHYKQDPFMMDNTIIKMAKKRALVDATLTTLRLSGIFTQDIEDFRKDEHKK